MRWSAETIVPAVRSEGLVVERLADETLIYDTERDEAHHLNPTAAAVFDLCDGRATVDEVAVDASHRLRQPVDFDAVVQALALLDERGLLSSAPELADGVSRRDVVRRAALVGAGAVAAAPVIKSIVAPTPAHAQSINCGRSGAECSAPTGEQGSCCEGLICCRGECASPVLCLL